MRIIPLINPKVMELQDSYVSLSNELKNAEILLECRPVWCQMTSSKYEKLLYSLICDAEKDIFALNREIDLVLQNMLKMGPKNGFG